MKYSAADGMVVGDEDEPDVLIGMAFDQSVKHESTGAASVNKTILYKVELDLPTISGKTKGEGDNAVANIEISGKAWPAYYTKTGGSTGRRTYCTVNSTLNPDKFAANNNTIVWPSDFTADA
ncbi:MAG: hypothetical protein IJ894_08455 [Bacteroidales bacterium]|nr:hypothetical protein [Bacteroidales bacterium]